MKKITFRSVLREFSSFLLFFLLVGFVVTCCMTLFLNVLANTMGLEYTPDNIETAAKITFLNVLIIAVIFKAVDYIRRKITVERPVKQITAAAERIMQGDFSARVPPIHGAGTDGFNQIGMAINQMAQELSGTETLRTDFIANVSHELKTPLAVMGNYATMLQKPGITEEERCDYAKAISEAARKLAQLITNILKLNKLENQQIFPETEEFDLAAQLCECVLNFEEVWERKNIQLEVDIPEVFPVRSDPELLSLAWNNLLSNAMKFTPEGGTVRVSLTREDALAVVSVSDTGRGMTAEQGKHIFEKFYQTDTSHNMLGNGLGLALVKRVVDITGSSITVQSAPGKGSTFTVRLGGVL